MEKNLLKFNVKNVKYAIDDEIKSIGTANSISIEANYSEQTIYADGEIIAIIPNDKGKTGTLSMVNIDSDYEVAMGRKLETSEGLASIQVHGSVSHSIYFETEAFDFQNKKNLAVKVWLLNVTTGAPSETYSQNTDNKNLNNYELSLNVQGVNLKDADGEDDYIDPSTGLLTRVYVVAKKATDADFDTFGETVPVPKVKVA